MQEPIIEKHPAIIHASDVAYISQSLLQHGIIYFAYTQITHGQFLSGLTNQRKWAELFLTKKYYDTDAFADHVFNLAKSRYYYLMWDNVPKKGVLLDVYCDTAALGFSHLFSIFEANGEYYDSYCFGTALSNEGANNFYINNLDILHTFIQYFKDVVKADKRLKSALTTNIVLPRNGYRKPEEETAFSSHIIKESQSSYQLKRYVIGNINDGIWLTSRELDYLSQLRLGKSMREIACFKNVSKRTVEEAITNIKEKLGCSTMLQLGEKMILLGINDYFKKTI